MRRLGRFADHDERRPEFWVGPSGVLRIPDHGNHGLLQRLAVGKLWIGGKRGKSADHQRDGALALDFPVRDDERASTGVEESARQARQRLGAGLVG